MTMAMVMLVERLAVSAQPFSATATILL